MDRIVTLQKINRWWFTGKVDASFLYKIVREEFNEITERLKDRRILNIK